MKDINFSLEEAFPDICNIYRETSTDVMYIFSDNGGVTPMFDPKNGLPLTYENWEKKYRK